VAYTLIENCKRHGLDLHDFLTSAMKAIVEQEPAHAPELTLAVIAKVRHLKKVS